MTTERRHIEVGGVRVEVVRKDVRNLHLGVYPPAGRVRVAAPLRLGDDAVRLAVVSRLGWIRRQQAAFATQERQSERELVSGESHWVEGRRLRLRVVEREGSPGVRVARGRVLELHVPAHFDHGTRRAVLDRWYRQRLRAHAAVLVPLWEPRVGVAVADIRVRRMRTRWGSCNVEARRIWLNLELAKKPLACLEFLIVHEMVHLLERRHTARFRRLMDELMPTWPSHRAALNRAPLAHEEWGY